MWFSSGQDLSMPTLCVSASKGNRPPNPVAVSKPVGVVRTVLLRRAERAIVEEVALYAWGGLARRYA